MEINEHGGGQNRGQCQGPGTACRGTGLKEARHMQRKPRASWMPTKTNPPPEGREMVVPEARENMSGRHAGKLDLEAFIGCMRNYELLKRSNTYNA